MREKTDDSAGLPSRRLPDTLPPALRAGGNRAGSHRTTKTCKISYE